MKKASAILLFRNIAEAFGYDKASRSSEEVGRFARSHPPDSDGAIGSGVCPHTPTITLYMKPVKSDYSESTPVIAFFASFSGVFFASSFFRASMKSITCPPCE